MSSVVNELVDKAMELSPDDRTILAHRIWNSLEGFVDEEIEKAWLDEAKKRWIEIELNHVKCISADDVLKEAKEKLDQL